jgi:hypothetical protein
VLKQWQLRKEHKELSSVQGLLHAQKRYAIAATTYDRLIVQSVTQVVTVVAQCCTTTVITAGSCDSCIVQSVTSPAIIFQRSLYTLTLLLDVQCC